MRPLSTDAPHFLIVKLTAIGDVIHGMPVASALREKYPHAKITWLAEGRCGDLLQGHAAIDELIVVKRRWLKSLSVVKELRRKLLSLKIDVTLDLQGLTKSAIAARLSGSKRRIGFAGSMGRELSSWLNNVCVQSKQAHVVDRYLELLQPLDIQSPAVQFNVPSHSEDQQTVDRLLQQTALGERFAIINPGAGWPSKLWAADRFAQVAAHLQQRGMKTLVVWAGNEEQQWADQIAAELSDAAIVAPNTSLTELGELCRRASLFISADTGPLHLAAAVGTPCVGLFGPMPAERNGPYGNRNISLQEVCLQGTSRERRNANNDSMLAITAEMVCGACEKILDRQQNDLSKQVA